MPSSSALTSALVKPRTFVADSDTDAPYAVVTVACTSPRRLFNQVISTLPAVRTRAAVATAPPPAAKTTSASTTPPGIAPAGAVAGCSRTLPRSNGSSNNQPRKRPRSSPGVSADSCTVRSTTPPDGHPILNVILPSRGSDRSVPFEPSRVEWPLRSHLLPSSAIWAGSVYRSSPPDQARRENRPEN